MSTMRRCILLILLDHFRNKRIPEIWKFGNARFSISFSGEVVIDGFSNSVDIAYEFADHFNSVFTPNGAASLET